MNRFEEFVYGMVRHHPFAKKVTKRLYQGFFDLLPRESEFLAGKYDYKEGFFFGFHDISPFSVNETKILACQIPFDGRMPQSAPEKQFDGARAHRIHLFQLLYLQGTGPKMPRIHRAIPGRR